ncbi:2-octaprenyl-6-methoxyphenyl hydroxylase [Vibrio gelatinilyticus]
MSKQYDLVIAGGAMTGSTLALALSQINNGALNIAVVEPFHIDNHQHPGFDARSIALSYGTVEILKRFDIWSAIADHATPITHIHVSDRGHCGMTDFEAQQYGLSAMGYVVELATVGARLVELLKSKANIDWLCPSRVVDMSRSVDSVALTLAGESEETRVVHAKLVVAADGANSQIGELAKLTMTQMDFEQTAVIANVVTSKAHQGQAFERFTPHGPLALLPMSDARSSLVWCMPDTKAQEVCSLSGDEFLRRLQHQFGWRLGEFTKVGSVASYPLILTQRPQNVSHRIAVVGNAAQTLHPIAGQGFNLGIRDVATLVDSLQTNIMDLGDYANLSQFRQRREADRELTVSLTSSLVHTFSNDWPAMVVARNLGLAIMDNLSVVKSPLFKRTAGMVEI